MHIQKFLNVVSAKLSNFSAVELKNLRLLLVSVWALRGRVNFANLARFGCGSERNLQRIFDGELDWKAVNLALMGPSPTQDYSVAFIDCTFVKKAGNTTYGLGYFWSGCDSRTQKGLEVSLLALFNPQTRQTRALEARQTSPNQNRMQQAIEQLNESLPQTVDLVVADGWYAAADFFAALEKQGKSAISILKKNTNMRYLATQEDQEAHRARVPRSRPLKYAGKVDWQNLDLKRFRPVELPKESPYRAYCAELNAPNFKRNFQTVVLINKTTNEHIILVCTDLQNPPLPIIQRYSDRFQIEFLFRDAKQHTGLNHAQTRQPKRLHYHFNLSFAAVNLGRELLQDPENPLQSLNDLKRLAYNERFLEILKQLTPLDLDSQLSPEQIQQITQWGFIYPETG